MEERRRHVRVEPLQQQAFAYLEHRALLIQCDVINVSDGGARIRAETMLPSRFMVFWREDGSERHACRVIWRDGLEVGVIFEDL